ncbi:hypothetical protein KAR48_02940 [bacterium]|nr:hypothetical protein [bacterium]
MRKAGIFILLIMAGSLIAQDLDVLSERQKEDSFPRVMSYEGFITEADGKAVDNGEYDFIFSIYTVQSGGIAIWTESHESVMVNGGLIQLYLGRGSDPRPLDLPFNTTYYLGIKVGNKPEMSPRMELTPSAYSFHSRMADEVADGSVSTEKLAANAVTDDKIKSVSWNKITDIPLQSSDVMTATGGSGWTLRGNIKTKPPVDFLGTIDFNDLVLKTDNRERFRLGKEGNTHVAHNILMQDDNAIGAAVITQITPGEVVYKMKERLIFDEDENDLEMMGADVGVNVQQPEGLFHVRGTGEISKKHIALFENAENEQGVAITKDQDVGIGTEEPLCKLHVKAVGRFATATTTAMEPLQTGKSVSEDEHVALFENTENGDGIAIKINAGTPGYDNNFVTFLNGSDKIVGRIEGETLAELHWLNWEFIWHTTMFLLDEVLVIAEGVACKKQGDGYEFNVQICHGVKMLAEYAEWEINRCLSAGVAYNSSAGDYAEYLERMNPDDIMTPGDIVGVFGGRISKDTRGAQQYMAVSTAPIVLGNMPGESNLHQYEKVAFMGQVPVKVSGRVEEGDYIIPSGLDDGIGIAVSPEMMTAREFCKVVGRAWSASENESVTFINVAVGLNGGDIAKFVEKQTEELLRTRSELSSLKQEVSQMKTLMYRMARDEKISTDATIIKTSLR